MRSVMAVALLPAPGATGLSGALNVYSRQPDGLRDADQHVALLLATHASLALACARTSEMAELRETHLQRAISSRGVIGEAKGILMGRQGISAEDAFDILRRTSQQLNTKLVQIAETLVARHRDLDRN
jgi:GAF domain-containing protein